MARHAQRLLRRKDDVEEALSIRRHILIFRPKELFRRCQPLCIGGSEYYEKSLRISRAANDRSSEAETYVFMAKAYESQAQYQQALDRLNLALKLYRELHDQRNEVDVLDLIAELEKKMKAK